MHTAVARTAQSLIIEETRQTKTRGNNVYVLESQKNTEPKSYSLALLTYFHFIYPDIQTLIIKWQEI